MRTWFAHGQWPRIFVRTHWFALACFTFLLITGLMLFLPEVHTVLIPILPLLYDLHITFGILLFVALFLPLIARLPAAKKVRRLDWAMTQVLIAAITMTGITLWLITVFPASWRSLAFTLHGDFAYIMGGWILIHFLLRAFSVGKRGGWVTQRVSWERRTFLKWSTMGVLGSIVWLAIGGIPATDGTPTVESGPLPLGKLPRPIPQFPEYYTVTGDYPAISATSYQLTVDGMVASPKTLDLVDLKRLPVTRIARNFQCVTGWVVPDVEWSGVSMRDLQKLAGAHPDAKYVTFYSADGVYTDSLRLDQLAPDVILAYAINGNPLPQQQGYPVRLIVPEMFGYKSIKWVNRVEFVKDRELGYWERNGYPANAYISGGPSL